MDPRERPTSGELLGSVEALAVVLGVDLDEPLRDLMPPGSLRAVRPQPAGKAAAKSAPAPSRPEPT